MGSAFGTQDGRGGFSEDTQARHALFPNRPARQRTLIRALLEGEAIPAQHAIVRNVSQDGLCITAMGLVPGPGDRIEVTMPAGIHLAGEVRWSEGTAFGVKLEGPLDLRQLAVANQRRNAGIADAIDMRVEQRLTAPPPPDPNLRRI